MGWAEKLPSGKYRAVYRDAQGRRRSAGTHTHKPAATRAANAEEERARKAAERDPDAARQTWGSWCDVWWRSRGSEASTLRHDAGRRRNHLDPRWAEVPLGSITRHDVRAWAADLQRKGLGPSTVKRCVHLFAASLNGAVDAEILTANPAARLRLGTTVQAQERFLTREEYAALWDAMPTTADQLVLELLCHTGMRWGELAGMHRTRVDLDRGLVRVVETYDEAAPGGGLIKAYPKGRLPRDVPLTAALVEQLREVDEAGRASCGVTHQAGKCPGPLLVSTGDGTPLRNSNWTSRVWRPAVARAGVGHVRVHDCRHTYASWLLQAGVPLAEVGRLLGHRSTQTTAKYAHLAETPTAAVLAALRGPGAPRLPHADV